MHAKTLAVVVAVKAQLVLARIKFETNFLVQNVRKANVFVTDHEGGSLIVPVSDFCHEGIELPMQIGIHTSIAR